jgi:uncharacterized protein YllA (UPF0747 family)
LNEVIDLPLINKNAESSAFSWDLETGPASAHLLPSQADINRNLDALFRTIPETEYSSLLKVSLQRSYDNCSFGDGFRNFVNSLLSETGIIYAGSNNATAKRLVSNELECYVKNLNDVHDGLQNLGNELSESYHSQVFVGDTLLFRFDDDGNRLKLELSDGGFNAGDNHFGEEELLDDIRNQPERYSPNVLLRPVLQDKLLPNLAYVGGGAEVAYLAQTAPLYDTLEVPRSQVVLRPSATFLWGKAGTYFHDFEKPLQWYIRKKEKIEADIALQHSASHIVDDIKLIQRSVHVELDKVRKKLGEIEETFQSTVKAADAKVARLFKHFEKKAINGLKRRQHIEIGRVEKVRDHVYPHEIPQERVLAMVELLNEFGLDVLDRLLESFERDWEPGNHFLFTVEPDK